MVRGARDGSPVLDMHACVALCRLDAAFPLKLALIPRDGDETATVLNVVLGLMPYLDNFAHIGGMLMGFLVGLGLLIQDREDEIGTRLEKKIYQAS